MTALQAAGGGLPLALHMPHIVEQIGAVAGFAAVLGLAILSALYFSQARDLRRLREWAGRAPERAAEAVATGQQPGPAVPGRVVAVPQRAPQAVQAPVPVASGGAAPAAAPAQQQGGQEAAGANGSPPAGGEAATGAQEKPEGDGAAPKPEGGEAGAKPGEAAGKPAAAEEPTGKPGEAGESDESESKPEGDDASTDDGAGGAKKPGMPAPASAAAAGAAAASASGPAAPGAAGTPAPLSGGPSAPPSSAARPPGAPAPPAPRPGGGAGTTPRPPGSVLPPRTGTVPPVRRIPAGTSAGNPALSQPGDGRTAEKAKRNPVYVVLAVVGVLVLGAGAAIGVPKLVNGGSSNSKSAKHTKTKTSRTKTAAASLPAPTKDITVAVLNGTTVPGLAAQIGDQIENYGFALGTVSNATEQQRANSVAMYASGHQADAQAVARRLHIKAVEPVDANSQAIAGDATVVVVVGSDQTR